VLRTILGTANGISGVLINADRNGTCGGGAPCGPNQLGVQNIHERVDNANRILVPAEGDASAILGNLVSINGHLTSACRSLVIQVVSQSPPC
jgi:hypothetical protein